MVESQQADYATPVMNPDMTPPPGCDMRWDDETEAEWRFGAPAPRTLLPCGCHLRRPDYEAVLCPDHLAELNAPRLARCVEEVSGRG